MHENPMACSLFGLGGRGSRGGGGVFRSGKRGFQWAEQGHPVPAHGVFGIEITAESVKTGNFLIRKAAHFTLYFVLGLGLTGAFHFQKKVPAWIPSLLLGAGFAATDEFHQSFTGRTAMVEDVVLDSCGVAAGCAAAYFFRRCWEKRRKKP